MKYPNSLVVAPCVFRDLMLYAIFSTPHRSRPMLRDAVEVWSVLGHSRMKRYLSWLKMVSSPFQTGLLPVAIRMVLQPRKVLGVSSRLRLSPLRFAMTSRGWASPGCQQLHLIALSCRDITRSETRDTQEARSRFVLRGAGLDYPSERKAASGFHR